jgi:hypothetical protein
LEDAVESFVFEADIDQEISSSKEQSLGIVLNIQKRLMP